MKVSSYFHTGFLSYIRLSCGVLGMLMSFSVLASMYLLICLEAYSKSVAFHVPIA